MSDLQVPTYLTVYVLHERGTKYFFVYDSWYDDVEIAGEGAGGGKILRLSFGDISGEMFLVFFSARQQAVKLLNISPIYNRHRALQNIIYRKCVCMCESVISPINSLLV